MAIEKYHNAIREAEDDPEYWHAVPATEFAIEIAHRMKEHHVSRSQLAERLGTTRPNVTKLLRGDARLNLMTMVKVAHALNAVVHVHVADRNTVTRWIDLGSSSREKGGGSVFMFAAGSGSGFAQTVAENTVATYVTFNG